MLAVGANELGEELGDTYHCPRCGEEHPIEYGEKILDDGSRIPAKTIAFVRCNDKIYLAGIDGRTLPPKREK